MDPVYACSGGASVRRFNWRRILALLRSEDLLTRLLVGTNAQIAVESISWNRYWAETVCRISRGHAASLDALRLARLRYIESGFRWEQAAPYCYAYFAFLRKVLDDFTDENASSDLLLATLGLECTSIAWAGQLHGLAAVTSTARNPAYLLARLKTPYAYDDPKFLPLITACDPYDQTYRLYYHYRQFSSGEPGGLRLLLYPPAATDLRAEAFRCIHAFAAGLARKQDTRAGKRATRIYDLAVGPILERDSQIPTKESEKDIRIVDLGSGSGDLTRGIIERLAARYSSVLEGRRIALTMVDVEFQNQRCHVRHWPYFKKLSAVRCRRSDYLSWIESQKLTRQEPGNPKPYDVVLLCRLLNNGSRFSINWVDDYYQARKLSAGALTYRQWKEVAYLPHIALNPIECRTSDLIASNASFRSRQGTISRQLSLTDYFRGLCCLIEGASPTCSPQEAVLFPVRRFNESSLLMPGGSSIFERLCRLAKAVIIEDVDLDARILRWHLEGFGLTALTATDATDRSQMHSSRLFCVAERSHAAIVPGRQIW